MKGKDECKIVQDLLPIYIDELTDKVTNEYIENHINQCQECLDIYNNMKNQNNNSEKELDIKKIKVMKKYNKRLSILKWILIILISIFVIWFIRKVIILNNYGEKSREFEYKNIFQSAGVVEDDGGYYKLDGYILNEKILEIYDINSPSRDGYNNLPYKIRRYSLKKDESDKKEYIFNEFEKTYMIDNYDDSIIDNDYIYDFIPTIKNDFWYLLKNAFCVNIVDNNESYIEFKNLYCKEGKLKEMGYECICDIVLDKKTGKIKNITFKEDMVKNSIHMISMDVVNDNVFVDPDLRGYKLEESK